jgi:hypothetical protein
MKKITRKTKKQIEEERIAKIPGIRRMRQENRSLTDIAAYFSVSINYVSGVCKDIKVDAKENQKNKKQFFRNPLPCDTYKLNTLSEEEQKKYNSIVPANREADKKSYITAKKGDYFKAVIFEDNKSNMNYKY